MGAISIAWPNDGLTGVPPDSAVLFGYELTSDDGLCPPDAFEVRVVDLATDLPVAGAVRFWNHGSFCAGKGATMRWVPAEPLLANAAYRVSIESDSVLHQGWGLVGAQSTFETGPASAPPALDPPQVTVEIEPFNYCWRLCMQPNTCKTGLSCDFFCEMRVRGLVTVGAVSGRREFAGYDGVAIFTGNAPYTFDDPSDAEFLGQIFHQEPGETVQVSVLLPTLDRSVVPCFTVGLWNLAGHWTSASVCSDPIVTSAILAKADGSDDAGDSAGDASACSVGIGHRGADAGWAALLALVAALRRRRAT